MQMLLQLLTAPRLVIDGETAHVGSRKALAILSLVALDGSATREHLAERLWPDADAAAARRNLRRELFRLRSLGVPLQDTPDGALALDGSIAVDALQLLLADVLPQSHGPALDGLDGIGDIEFDAWLQRWREKLSVQHARVLEREGARREESGDLAGALALHAQRWTIDSCNEAAAGDVIRLRTALGDRAGALQAYERLAATLRAELDLDPSEPTRRLAGTLREHLGVAPTNEPAPVADDAPTDTAGDAAQARIASAAEAMPPIAPFIARSRIQTSIEAAWTRGQRVYLHGPAGAGKTRLASEMAAARGAWLRVACEPQDAEVPYASVVRLLRALRNSAPDVVLPDWVRRELTQLMPELGEPPQALATEEARQRLLAAIGEAWRLLMRDNFSAIVLDDWHWGDQASVAVWSRLEDVERAESVVWLIAYRSAQLPAAALDRQRADIDSRHGIAIELEGLEPDEVLALTHALSGSGGGRLFSQRLHDATEGNPFFLLETLRHLFEQGLLTADNSGWSTPFDERTENYAELPVPASVRAAVQARVRALGASVQRLLEAASLGGPDLDAALLASVTGVEEEAVVGALEHARTAQLVHETENGWRFAHDLVRQSLVQGLSAGRRRLLHERLALQLESADVSPALVAAQWEAAKRPRPAVRWRIAAAEAALRVHALSEALANYGQALANGAAGREAVAIHLACAEVHRRCNDRSAADSAFDAAMGVAASSAVDRAAMTEAQLARAQYLAVTDRVDECLAVLDALAPDLRAAPPEVRARALAVRGAGLMRRSDYNAATALLTEAEQLLENVPSARHHLAALLLDLVLCSNWRGDIAAWERYARRAVAVHESLGDRTGLATALSRLSLFLKATGQNADAIAVGERARGLSARAGDVPVHRGVNIMLLQAYLDAGDTDRVVQLVDEAEGLAPSFENELIELNFLAARFYVHVMRGEVAQARAVGDRLLGASRGKGQPLMRVAYLLLVAELWIELGDWRAARAAVDEAQALDEAHRARGNDSWFAVNLALNQAMLALGDGRPADALELLPSTGLDEIDARFYRSAIGAEAALALGDTEEARRRIEEVRIDEAAPVRPLVGWLEQRLALAAAVGRADPGAVARAEALLAERRVPALRVERLRRALDAAQH